MSVRRYSSGRAGKRSGMRSSQAGLVHSATSSDVACAPKSYGTRCTRAARALIRTRYNSAADTRQGMRTELSTEPLSHEPNRIARSPAPPGAGVAPWTIPPALPPAAEWQRYLAAALRFKWVVLGVTLACTALGVLGALLVKPSYV